MKIWDFSYFFCAKTMGIPPTLSFDTTTTSMRAGYVPDLLALFHTWLAYHKDIPTTYDLIKNVHFRKNSSGI